MARRKKVEEVVETVVEEVESVVGDVVDEVKTFDVKDSWPMVALGVIVLAVVILVFI